MCIRPTAIVMLYGGSQMWERGVLCVGLESSLRFAWADLCRCLCSALWSSSAAWASSAKLADRQHTLALREGGGITPSLGTPAEKKIQKKHHRSLQRQSVWETNTDHIFGSFLIWRKQD